MTEEKKMEKRGLGKKKPKVDPLESSTTIAAEKTPVVPKKPSVGKRKPSNPQLIILILIGLLAFVGVGLIVWNILYNKQEQLAKVAQQSTLLKQSVSQISKNIPQGKSLGSLKNLNQEVVKTIADLEALKITAQNIGDQETSKNIDLDLAGIKPIADQIKFLIDEKESQAVSAINEIEKSVKPFVNIDKLSCDQLLDAPKKFDEAIAKLSNSKNVPVEAVANTDARKLVTNYINFKQKASDLFNKKNCGFKPPIPIPPNPTPVNPDPTPANPEPPAQTYIPPEPPQPDPPQKSNEVPICPPGKPLKEC